tara:strand:- start:545 stop:697 length:153 start_codon:yes stop_codon:yes gene_type:complete
MIGEFSDGISENLNPETPLPNENFFYFFLFFFIFKKVNKIKDLEQIKIVV